MRLEECPSHNVGQEYGDKLEFCGIIGAYDDTSLTIEETAIKEIKEETGYTVDNNRLQYITWVWDSKVADTKVHLFVADLTELEQGEATTDGTELEKNSSCVWVDLDKCMSTKDSKVHTILNLSKKLL